MIKIIIDDKIYIRKTLISGKIIYTEKEREKAKREKDRDLIKS